MIEEKITGKTIEALVNLYNHDKKKVKLSLQLQKTRPEFEGDITLLTFPLTPVSKKSPEQTAAEIGDFLKKEIPEIKSFNVIKGFLNLVIDETYWLDFFAKTHTDKGFGNKKTGKSKPVVVEFSSPNTNKPLHLGHIRNNLLGHSITEILKANGENVVKVNLVNDRGIHICKSMLAYMKWGNDSTPESTGFKGDHFVGNYYVMFEKEYKKQVEDLVKQGRTEEDAKKQAPLIIEAQEMLKKWENNDKDIRALWQKMNGWVYDGFEKTYKRLGITFDKTYYESKTYLSGKEIVEKGVSGNIFAKKDDGSVWADMSDKNMDEKLLLRADGTSVYITQDLGTAKQRYDEYDAKNLIYVVGNEQNYHFEILKIILQKLGYEWADKIYHLSYGMVELPHGKMKSREGTVVDADDLIEEMYKTAYETTKQLGKTDDFSEQEMGELSNNISMGALKYFILKVDPKKNMLFNPEESIDFNGNTGPFIQYTHARIQSILRKSGSEKIQFSKSGISILKKEKEIIKLLYEFPEMVSSAAESYNPAVIANYVYELAKEYNQYYQETPILKEENKDISAFRVMLSSFTGDVIKKSMKLLGIEVPEKM